MDSTINDIIGRRSVKSYKSDQVPDEMIRKIAEAGTYAPTGMGKQSPIIIAVTNKEIRDELSKLNARIMGMEGMDPFYGAPVVFIVLADKSVNTHIYDGTLVMANLMLAAHSLGLGSCWIHRAKEEFETEEGIKILEKLGITGNYEGIGHCIVGYKDKEIKQQLARKSKYIYYLK